MLTRISFLMFITVCVLWLGTNIVRSQSSVDVFQKDLREKANFEESDLAALDQGEPVVRLLHVLDKREVAVCGLVTMQAPAEVFLQSFRESMVRKSNPAILEIGSFSSTPTLDDLQALTFEGRDIEDLKGCVVGDCKVKLSAAMIERFHNEINWDAADYHLQSTQLFKRILLDYVRDYVARGDDALIQ